MAASDSHPDPKPQTAAEAKPALSIMRLSTAEDCRSDRAAGSFMQSRFWGLFKARTGWEAYEVSGAFGEHAPPIRILVLRRRLARVFSFLYVPHGPPEDFAGSQLSRAARMRALGQLASALARTFGCRNLFIRFDLDWERDSAGKSDLPADVPLRRGADVQVPDTVILDLSASEKELLEGMKPKWRYNIRLAERKGVKVTEAGNEGISDFMALYSQTARRDRIAIHAQSYYETLFKTAEEVASVMKAGGAGQSEKIEEHMLPSVSLYIAEHEGDKLAAIIVLRKNRHATYLYGASADTKRNLMPAYALQWHAICQARQKGCISYDFFGIPPDASDPSHPLAGLYLFKTGFGGRIVHREGAWDYPIHPLWHAIYRGAEQVRLFWHRNLKKTLRRFLIHQGRHE